MGSYPTPAESHSLRVPGGPSLPWERDDIRERGPGPPRPASGDKPRGGIRKPVCGTHLPAWLICPPGPPPASYLKLPVSVFTLSKTVAPPSLSLPSPIAPEKAPREGGAGGRAPGSAGLLGTRAFPGMEASLDGPGPHSAQSPQSRRGPGRQGASAGEGPPRAVVPVKVRSRSRCGGTRPPQPPSAGGISVQAGNPGPSEGLRGRRVAPSWDGGPLRAPLLPCPPAGTTCCPLLPWEGKGWRPRWQEIGALKAPGCGGEPRGEGWGWRESVNPPLGLGLPTWTFLGHRLPSPAARASLLGPETPKQNLRPFELEAAWALRPRCCHITDAEAGVELAQ